MSRFDNVMPSEIQDVVDGHFNNILDVLKNKRELTDPYRDAYKAYVVESQSEIAMWQLLNAYEAIFNPK